MQRHEFIYELIQALSGSEKRYVLKHLRIHREESNHVHLFKALEALKQYDINELREKLQDTPILKHLDVAKVQLYDICLRHLRAFHENNNIELKINASLAEAILLLQRGMYAHSRRRLQQVRVAAERVEQLQVLLEINQRERELEQLSPSTNNLESIFQELDQEEEKLYAQIANYRQFINAANRISTISKLMGSAQATLKLEEMRITLTQPPFQSIDQALTVKAKRLFYYTLASYSQLTGHFDKALALNIKQIELLESHPDMLPGTYRHLISALYNLLVTYFSQGNYKEAFKTIAKLRELPQHLPSKIVKSEDFRHRLLIRIMNLELAVLTRMGRFQKEDIENDELNEIIKILDDRNEIIIATELRYGAAHYYYGAGDPRRALRYLNMIINKSIGNILHPHQVQAWLLRLIIQRERKEERTYSYLLRSTEKWINEQESDESLAKIVLNFLKTEQNGGDVYKAAENMNLKLKELLNIETAATIFDYLAWTESILKKRTYAALLAEKYQKSNKY